VPAPNPPWNPRVAKILQQRGWTISKDTCRASWKPGSTETAVGMLGDIWTVEVGIVCGQLVRLQSGDGDFRF
jgi:uncharacterized protein YvpB